MKFLYTFGVRLYGLGIKLTAVFQPKAKEWIKGRENWSEYLKRKIDSDKSIVWFHCASVGEFEQARPVIENIQNLRSRSQILVTFFSPSGYQQYHDYSQADVLTYLPLDVPENVELFLDIAKPCLALFVKYEFWFNFIESLQVRGIPISVFSATFRTDQLFFKTYGKWALELLKRFDSIFLQDQKSGKLLDDYSVSNYTYTGDTRFDRVFQIQQEEKLDEVLSIFKEFANGYRVIISGSSWEKEDEYLVKFIENNHRDGVKYIIAPHEMNKDKIERLISNLPLKIALFSQLNENSIEADVIVVDGIGYLSRIYRFGDIAIVGGGFNGGIHNTLEPATFGMPILFGPKFKKFSEAIALIEDKVGYPFDSYQQFENHLSTFLDQEELRKEVSKKCKEFVQRNIGASKVISEYVINKVEA